MFGEIDFLLLTAAGLIVEIEIMKTWNIREYHKTLLRHDVERAIRFYRTKVLEDEPGVSYGPF